jgi:hypothetical protein
MARQMRGLSRQGIDFCTLLRQRADEPGLMQLYTPGPQETLTNFEVHLRNRQHRHRVNSRIGGVVMVEA